MDLADFGKELAKIGLPLLGAVLPIPGGAAIGTALAAAIGSPSAEPSDILATLKASSEAVDSAKQFQLQHQETMLKLTIDAETAQMQAVNATLQADARGDSWLQKNHHAMESLAVVAMVIAIYFILPLCKIPVPSVPEAAYMMLGAILGVSAWKRGDVNKQIAVNNGGN